MRIWANDGRSLRLADRCIPCETIRLLLDADCGWRAARCVDFDHSPPLGKSGARGVVFVAALVEIVEALRGRLARRGVRRVNGRLALIDLDSGDDILGFEKIDEGRALRRLFKKRLLKADSAK